MSEEEKMNIVEISVNGLNVTRQVKLQGKEPLSKMNKMAIDLMKEL